jgi:hypothetical protein
MGAAAFRLAAGMTALTLPLDVLPLKDDNDDAFPLVLPLCCCLSRLF